MNGTINTKAKYFAFLTATLFIFTLANFASSSAVAAQDSFVSVTSKYKFSTTVKRLQRQIAAHKLVMLKKYNVQAMLKMVGVKSGKALTLAIFHPRYGKVIFANDKNATSAAPLRMSVQERGGKVIVGYIRPSAVFANFNVPRSFKKELDGLFESIVKKATQ